MLFNNDYIVIINEIRNLDDLLLDSYINKKLIPLRDDNDFFIEKLYKDIFYIIYDIDTEGDNDIIIENGDIVIENGDFKLTGYQTRLYKISTWLNSEIKMKMANQYPFTFTEQVENFEKFVLKNNNYTVEYKQKLDEIKSSLRKEWKQNYNPPKSKIGILFSSIFDLDNFDLSPKFSGFGIDLKKIIQSIKSNN